MLRILWERRFIDESQVKSARSSRYSKDCKKGDLDADGNLTDKGEHYSLNALLMKCIDFRTKVTDLKHLAKELSTSHHLISILFIPKFHCEFADDGIAYSWGASKRYYRKQLLSKKKSCINFENFVWWSVGRVTNQMCPQFLPKARGYILVYHHKVFEKTNANCKSESDAIKLKFRFLNVINLVIEV